RRPQAHAATFWVAGRYLGRGFRRRPRRGVRRGAAGRARRSAFIAAMKRRGIDDPSKVWIETWASGNIVRKGQEGGAPPGRHLLHAGRRDQLLQPADRGRDRGGQSEQRAGRRLR